MNWYQLEGGTWINLETVQRMTPPPDDNASARIFQEVGSFDISPDDYVAIEALLAVPPSEQVPVRSAKKRA